MGNGLTIAASSGLERESVTKSRCDVYAIGHMTRISPLCWDVGCLESGRRRREMDDTLSPERVRFLFCV